MADLYEASNEDIIQTVVDRAIVNSFVETGSDGVYYNLKTAFPMKVINKNGGRIQVKTQRNTGSKIPTLVGRYQSALEAKEVAKYIKNIAILQLGTELSLDLNETEDAQIDRNLAIQEEAVDNDTAAFQLCILGSVVDGVTKEQMSFVDNSLVGLAVKQKSLVNFLKANANDCKKQIAASCERVRKASQLKADTCIMSERVFTNAGLSDASYESGEFINYITKTLKMNLYVTDWFDDVGEYGDCILTTVASDKVIELIYGKTTFTRANERTNLQERVAFFTSVAGFDYKGKQKGAVDMITNCSEDPSK